MGFLYRVIATVCAISGFVQAQEAGPPAIRFYFFYSQDCESCKGVSKEILSRLDQQYNLEVRSLNIDDFKNYQLLFALEGKHGDTDNEIPVIVIGEYIFGGTEEIQENLEKTIEEYERSGCDFPNIKTETNRTDSLNRRRVYLAYFYGRRCKKCDRLTYELDRLESRFPNLVIGRFDIDDPEAKKLNQTLCESHNVPEQRCLVAPMVFVGEDFLVQDDVRGAQIAVLVQKYQKTGTGVPWEEAGEFDVESSDNIRERFTKLGILTVVSAGLIDGVNPCAFATILFFIAFLSFVRTKGKEILIIGAVFTASVFVVYFLIGIGIFSLVVNFVVMPTIRKVLFSVAGILAIVLGVLSLYDYFKFRKGKYGEAKLQLPGFLKKKIHSGIREHGRMKNHVVAALCIGLLVSLSEFACTGQVYLPTITFVTTQVASLRVKGLTYLMLYNLAFILPLIAVFAAAYKGTTSTDLNLFWRRHGASTKLAISILFFALGGLLLFYAYY
jgi:thiol-disulfide isomerase/thioredoxin